ncbi:MAG TPA: hypothetical protein VK009_19205 [Chloroflexota bacterium]|nr:hypothetical protein [Chloroflexota bacterium]
MASIGPIQPGAPYLPPPRDAKLAKRRKASYDKTSDDADQLEGSAAGSDDYEANLLVRFPPGSGPISWIARLIYQTYHSVLKPKLGRIVDILA